MWIKHNILPSRKSSYEATIFRKEYNELLVIRYLNLVTSKSNKLRNLLTE
jgi:hypothetical protein